MNRNRPKRLQKGQPTAHSRSARVIAEIIDRVGIAIEDASPVVKRPVALKIITFSGVAMMSATVLVLTRFEGIAFSAPKMTRSAGD